MGLEPVGPKRSEPSVAVPTVRLGPRRWAVTGSLHLRHCQRVKVARLCVQWAEELQLPWAETARRAAARHLTGGRWSGRLKNGTRSTSPHDGGNVFRGTMLPVQTRSLTAESRRLFTTEVQAPVLALAELYGGKLVAALDRQHPRDLFDIHCLFESGGLTAEMVECFVGYLAGHKRQVHEVLFSPSSRGIRPSGSPP